MMQATETKDPPGIFNELKPLDGLLMEHQNFPQS